ncbi:MAG TPA: hypothetical protein VER12_17555 [Polyangiaceae bacterium]|nr:hypothetical protein [Polyangiaceae bacterium]
MPHKLALRSSLVFPAEAWAARLAPEPFRDFLPYASASALKVIHAREVLKRALDVAQHYSQPGERARGAERLQASLAAEELGSVLSVASEPPERLVTTHLGERERRMIGERVLALYFHLLHYDGPLFLDLRLRHFGWDAATEQLRFYPSALWCRPDPEFMQRLRSLYVGFYDDDDDALQRGLDLYRWNCRPSAGFSRRIEQLLRRHFGAGERSEMRFSIAQFRSTFDAIFNEAAQSQARLHPELTFLGVELIGLYLTLEALEVPLNPRAAFDGAR